jgi:hypothetical protein
MSKERVGNGMQFAVVEFGCNALAAPCLLSPVAPKIDWAARCKASLA